MRSFWYDNSRPLLSATIVFTFEISAIMLDRALDWYPYGAIAVCWLV